MEADHKKALNEKDAALIKNEADHKVILVQKEAALKVLEAEHKVLLVEKEADHKVLLGEKVSAFDGQLVRKEADHKVLLGEKVSEYKAILVCKDNEIANEKTSRLQAQGTMTSRGVFEQVMFEIGTVLLPKQRKPTVTDVCRMIGEMIYSNKRTGNSNADSIIEMFKTCGIKDSAAAINLYSVLSVEVHGFPWNGGSVRVFTKDLGQNEVCIVEGLCKYLHLNIELI